MKTNLPVTQNELMVEEHQRIISTTDIKGRITSINQAFIDISGFSEEELLGQSHNIVRHPDMPPAAFADLWETLKRGEAWLGLVKNRCKNGDHYWVNAYATPIYKGKALVGYQSVRTRPEREYVEQADKLYGNLKKGKGATSRFSLPFKVKQFLGGLVLAGLPLCLTAIIGGSNLMGLGLGVGAALIAAALLCYWQQRPWNRLKNLAKTIHDSDLACLAYRGCTDPADQVEVAIKALQSQHMTVVELLQNSATLMMSLVEKNNHIVQQNNQGLSQQSMDISQLATAVNEMTSTIHEVAKNAEETASSSQSVGQDADQGMHVVSQATESITALSSEVDRACQLTNQLKIDTGNITNIINVISDIADQTNLLALNAAIEAARAGESGRGFAVVADEVRTLASRTQNSTSEIESMINSLQNQVDQVVSVMEGSHTHAEKTVNDSTEINNVLQKIVEAVSAVNDMNTQIATATEEQSAVTEEINKNVTSIHDATNEITQAAEESASSGLELEKVANDLNSMVTHFRR